MTRCNRATLCCNMLAVAADWSDAVGIGNRRQMVGWPARCFLGHQGRLGGYLYAPTKPYIFFLRVLGICAFGRLERHLCGLLVGSLCR